MERDRDAPGAWARETRRHYDALVDKYVDAYFDDRTDWPWLREFASAVGTGGVVLDAGCGPGNYSAVLVREGLEVVGIDLSPEMIKAAQRLVPEARFRVLDFSNLDQLDAQFDGILCAYSLLHVPGSEVSGVLRLFHSCLEASGFMGLLTKVGDGAAEPTSPLAPELTCLVHLFPEDEVVSLVRRAGFEVVERRRAPAGSTELQYEKFFLLARRAET